MITLLKENTHGFVPVSTLENGVWLRAIDPNAEEQERLKTEFGVDPDMLSDILDIDEQARIEKEADGLTAIIRIPVFDPEREVAYFTVPYGIIIRQGCVITVCLCDNPVGQDVLHHRIRGLNMGNANNLILNSILRASVYYLRFLKDINRLTGKIERDLHKAVRNVELLELMRYQKSLVYFTTSLRTNELLLEKIQKLSAWHLSEDEQETLEDVRIELKQAMEMARIYNNIVTGLMDTFSSIISNNLNNVMKSLTTVSVTLMLPTLVASVYGMNVDLPFQHQSWAFVWVLGLAAVLPLVAIWIFKIKKLY